MKKFISFILILLVVLMYLEYRIEVIKEVIFLDEKIGNETNGFLEKVSNF